MMTNIRATLLAAAAIGAVLAAAPALASPTSPLSDAQRALIRPAAGIPAHKLKSVTIDQQSSQGTALPAGFTTIDSTVVKCAAESCTIGFGIMAQVGGQTAASDQFAICAVVDGSYASPGCPYQGELQTDGTYRVGNSRQSATVGHGSHTVSVQVYVVSAATLGEYEADYSIYTP